MEEEYCNEEFEKDMERWNREHKDLIKEVGRLHEENKKLKEEIKEWLLKQMKKGKGAELRAEKLFDKIPDMIYTKDKETITLNPEELNDIIIYTRFDGIANWILTELYLSARDELGIELKTEED